MNYRDCEGLYKCGQGTEEKCRKALCPFYKPPKTEEKKATTYLTTFPDYLDTWRIKRANETTKHIRRFKS